MSSAEQIIAATQEIFSSMIMLDVTAGTPRTEQQRPFRNSVTGLVGMAGQVKGLMAIHLPFAVAKAVTSSFLGMDVAEIDDDVRDAIGELANMLAGSIKGGLDASGNEIKLSIPTAISGSEYTIDNMTDADITIVPFTLEAGEFTVELQFEANKDA